MTILLGAISLLKLMKYLTVLTAFRMALTEYFVFVLCYTQSSRELDQNVSQNVFLPSVLKGKL